MNSFVIFPDNNNLEIKNESSLNSINNKKYSQYLQLSNDEIKKEVEIKKKKIVEYHNLNKILKKELTLF